MRKGISVTFKSALLSLVVMALCFQQAAAQTLFAANTVLANYSISGGKISLLPPRKVMSPLTIGTNYLVSHNEINQKLQEGYFLKKSGVTVPADNFCITVDEAKTWLYLDESLLPTNGRMPLWQELVPLIPSVTVSFTLAPSSAPAPMLMEVRFSNVTLAPISFKWGYCVYNTTIPAQSCYGFSGASNGGTPTQTTIPTGTMGYTQYSSSNTVGANYGYIVKIVIYDIQGIPASKIQLAAGQNYSLVVM
jgi:hypothetical protein